ncbi:MAG: hypothetical protein LAT62_02070 [Natronospirillum sp.]|uniref:hypothetical protein n=1 Tax=Natronospirillum sp. TaxID=2812955 RepID=UPI0025D8FAD9|nr:hypothetical protein [Natronospirillum sp.]MCH8550692.1 hypothetical protein [Natronospirillum sp.]
MSQRSNTYLNPPEPSRKALSFSNAKPRSIEQWVEQLPKVNHTETSRKLFGALREINQLKISPADKLELLDILAPEIEYAADGLFRKYLERPFALDELERKVLSLTHGLATELGTGYKGVAFAATSGWGLGRKEITSRALHHCICAILPNLRRMFSLYLPAPKGFWLELHGLYQHGLKEGNAEHKHDWLGESTTLAQSYKAALLFSIAQPFQLQRHELEPLYRACLSWSSFSKLEKASQGGIYVVDLSQDYGPAYLTPQTTLHAGSMSLHTDKLVKALQKPETLPDVRGVTDRLREHLSLAWDRAQPRRFRRKPSEGQVSVTLGLSAVHSQLCHGKSFDSFLTPYEGYLIEQGSREDRFQARDTMETIRSRDVWEYSFDAGDNRLPDIPAPEQEEAAAIEEEYIQVPEYPAAAINMSPRGFCLHWPEPAPESLVMGEVISVKPENASHRTIGLLRWLRQYRGSGVRGGVELLSPQAEACAARILNKTGQHSSFLRAIVLPEIKAVAQPESVILPRLRAQAGQKIMLYRRGKQQAYRLVRKITETSAVGQFAITLVGTAEAEKPSTQPGLDLQNDPLWRQF